MSHERMLRRADLRVAEGAAKVTDTFRLHYHLMPPAHWMNDPNGLVYFQGYYHVFYQHHPYGPQWGPMHWGHARTKDFITWEHLPMALAPSEDYDAGGCFSGSAVEKDGVLHLFYTGVREEGGKLIQVQCLATSRDGIRFRKDHRNPLITNFPPEGSVDFRDPKVWQHGGKWYMALGSGNDGRGKVLLYRSNDLSQWDYMGVAAKSDGTQGTIWECPDLFPLGDKHVLLVSPMGTEPRRVLYAVGEMDYEVGKFQAETWGELDKGPDFYAPQTFFGTDRRIMLAWMQSWEGEIPSQKHNWAGALTLPRELMLDSARRLQIRPLPELKRLRADLAFASDLVLQGETRILPSCSLQERGLEAVLRVDLAGTSAAQFGIAFGEGIRVGVAKGDWRVYLDTTRASRGHRGRYSCKLSSGQEKLEIRIFLDRSSIELFGAGEAACLTARVYPSSPELVPQVFARGGVLKASLELWSLSKRG